jgi:signal transduction histidine kinase
LVVEDSKDDTLLIIRELRNGGYDPIFEQVDTSATMASALEKQTWDIIIADYIMPHFSGPDALKLLQESALDLPLIIVSGKIGEDTAVAIMKAGAHDYIMKDNLTRLATAVERELKEVEVRRGHRQLEEALQESRNELEKRRAERSRELSEANDRLQIEITERKQAEKALRNNIANFRKLITENADGIVIIDRKGIIRLVNQAAEALFRRNAEQLLGELFGFPLVAGKTTELDIVHGNEETSVAEMRVVETEWEGKTAYLASLRDITERKRAEEKLRELDRMKSEFISNVSHELRSPLHSIRGFTKLLLAEKVPDPETQKEFLTTIDKQSEQLGNLIDDLLNMSRLESGRFQIYKERISIKNTIHDAVEGFHSLASEKSIVINEDIRSTLPEIDGDRERLGQVIDNLLSNAIKFSNDGGRVTVNGEVNGSELLVRVTDCGIGISKETMPHLFERFYRAKDLMARGGTGLGLYISKQIIEAHGGRIWAESKVGEGSIFSFTLPLNRAGGDSDE